MKFGDVATAVAVIAVITTLLDAVLLQVLVPAMSAGGTDVSGILSTLVASLIVGYVFALKIQEESKTRAIGVIVVLSTFTFILFLGVWIANPFASPWFKDTLNNDFNKSVWTNYDLAAYSALIMSVDAIITLVTTFIGLYAGSMLRNPSAKTKG